MATKKRIEKGTNGQGKIWRGGAPKPLSNGRRAVGAGKGGTVRKHGTSTGYQRGCRCGACKTAMSDWRKARRAVLAAAKAERTAA